MRGAAACCSCAAVCKATTLSHTSPPCLFGAMAAAPAPIASGEFAPGEEAKVTAQEVEEEEDTSAAPGEEAAPVPTAVPGEAAGTAVSLTVRNSFFRGAM